MASGLQRSLTLVQLVFYGVGTIVGAGIYSILGAASGVAGASVWVSLLLASITAFITALSYAELISAFPRAGAEYHFVRNAFPGARVAPFLAGYLIAFNSAATCATVALAFGGYLRVFLDIPAIVTAFGLLVACTVVNIAGIRQSTWIGIFLICVEVGGLLVLTAGGLVKGDPIAAIRLPDWPSEGIAVLSATSLVFFIFIGFEDIANLARRPKSRVAMCPARCSPVSQSLR
jgi:basic amino acid/polyamine antiporter, APA family